MKLEVGQYVRTKKGNIGKITDLPQEIYKDANGVEYRNITSTLEPKECLFDDMIEKQISKASHNIIDLIEVGDYINGMRVQEYEGSLIINQNNGSYVTIEEFFKCHKLKSIVTEEMMESVSYYVK